MDFDVCCLCCQWVSPEGKAWTLMCVVCAVSTSVRKAGLGL